MIKAKDLVSAGLSFQENSGETLSPSQVKRTGMAPPGLKSELISCMELLRYWDCILDSMRTQGVARRQGLVWSKQKSPSPGGASRQESSGERSSPSQVNPIGITPAPTGVRDAHPRTRASQEPTGHHQTKITGDGKGSSPETLKRLAILVSQRRSFLLFSKESRQWLRSCAPA